MNSKRRIVLVLSLALCLSAVSLGFWFMTEPQQDADSSEVKQCLEYLEQLEMLNRYKLFWTFIQRRVAYSNCMERLAERRNKPQEDHSSSN